MAIWRISAPLLALVITGSASADALISYKSSDGLDSAIGVRQGIVTSILGDTDGLFDSSRNKMVLIDHERRAYYEMDPETMKQQMDSVSTQLSAQMEQMLANMPEDQRELMKEQMAKMMGQEGGGEMQPKIEFRKTGQSQTVAGFKCKIVEVMRGGGPIQRVCVTPVSDLGISGGDVAALEKMFTFMRDMSDAVSSMRGDESPDAIMNVNEMGGVPMRIEDLTRGEVSEVTGVSTASQPAYKYSIPAGYQKQAMPGL